MYGVAFYAEDETFHEKIKDKRPKTKETRNEKRETRILGRDQINQISNLNNF